MTVFVDRPERPSGLAFVLHGLGGWKEQPHVAAAAEAFLEAGLTVVRYDATDGVGEAGGSFAEASTTGFCNDLEDVVAWASEQGFYREPFFLSGHSLGGMACGFFAEKHPEKVAGLALLAAVVSGELSFASEYYRPKLEAWKAAGWIEMRNARDPEKKHRLHWGHVEDRFRFDLLPDAGKLAAPTLLIVGERDNGTPPEHQRLLFDALRCPKELHIVPGAGHAFWEESHLRELKRILAEWLAKLDFSQEMG
jgi:pimeloyl-ACP methyl ester carboxylesterase